MNSFWQELGGLVLLLIATGLMLAPAVLLTNSGTHNLICHPPHGGRVVYRDVQVENRGGVWNIYDPKTGMDTYTNMACKIQIKDTL